MSSYEEADKVAEWLGDNGYWVQLLDGGRLGFHIVAKQPPEFKATMTNAQLIQFAKSKGWKADE